MILQDTELVIESLDIIRDLVTKFGHQMEWVANDLQGSLAPKLVEERGAIRKRAIQCLGEDLQVAKELSCWDKRTRPLDILTL